MSPPPPATEHIRVAVQVRPLLPFEALNSHSILSSPTPNTLQLSHPPHSHLFTDFDAVHEAPALLFHSHVQPLLPPLFNGYNATVLAYGQTSSGKTYTISHLTTLIIENLFSLIRNLPSTHLATLRVGVVELYKDSIRDLVDPSLPLVPVHLRQRGNKSVFLDGAREKIVTSEQELNRILHDASLLRRTAATGMNASSSRSHSVVTFTLQVEKQAASTTTAKLHLVDLAGSERAKRTKVDGIRLAEGIDINKGLLALAKCISALAANAKSKSKNHQHVPYRDSKLTRLLQDSLGGNSKTLLVACVSPSSSNADETLGTLRYAQRARMIRNRPTVNTGKHAVEVSDLRAQLARTKAEIAAMAEENERLRRGLTGGMSSSRCGCSASNSHDNVGSSVDSIEVENADTKKGSFVVVREDDVVSGLRYRIRVLEDVLERATLTPADRETLLGNKAGNALSGSPLGKLKNVGLKGLAIEEDNVNKRKRVRAARRVERRGGGVTRRLSLGGDGGGEGRKRGQMNARRHAVEGVGAKKKERREIRDGGLEETSGGESSESEEVGGEEALMARMAAMRKGFMERLRRAEADRKELEAGKAELAKKVTSLQRKHEGEAAEMKGRVAEMRGRLVEVKRLQVKATRLEKMREGSEAGRLKLLGKCKGLQKEKDEAISKLVKTNAEMDGMKRNLEKENRQLERMERALRTELRKVETNKSKAEGLVNRLRVENETLKLRMRNMGGGKRNVRRVNSSIPHTTTTRASATCS